MEYKGTYYLYELDVTNEIHQCFTDDNTEFYVITSNNDGENNKLAISRQRLYLEFGIMPKENDYDVFEIDTPITYYFDNGCFKMDETTYRYLTDFIGNIHLLLKSFGRNILMQNIDDKNRIINILRADYNASPTHNPYGEPFVKAEYKLQLIFDKRYLIQDSRGNTILRLNNDKNAKQIFHLISKMIDNIITPFRKKGRQFLLAR